MRTLDAYLHPPGASELRLMGDVSTHFLAVGEQTGGVFALVDEQAPRGMSVPLHRHADDFEAFYVIDGELTLWIDEEPGQRVGAGAFAYVPGGAVHGFRVESESARYLLLTTPRHGDFYRAITEPADGDGGPPLDSTNGPEIESVARAYGIEFVAPLPDPGDAPF